MGIDHFHTIVDNFPETQIIETLDDEIIGYVRFVYRGLKTGHIFHLYVDHKYRRLGIATRLIEYCIYLGRDDECEKIVLMIKNANQSAYAFYKSTEFIAVDHHVHGTKMSIQLNKG